MMDELVAPILTHRNTFVAEGVPQLWRQGRVLEVLDRNRSDVELNRDIFEFGRDVGYVVARAKDGIGFEQLEVDWN